MHSMILYGSCKCRCSINCRQRDSARSAQGGPPSAVLPSAVPPALAAWTGWPAAHDALISLAWSAGILLAFAILSACTYARMSR
jgi:hypothetical protein